MTPAFENLQKALKGLPGLGYRSAERIALHLLFEKPERLPALVGALREAQSRVHRCGTCGNISESEVCGICANPKRDRSQICVVEQAPDVAAFERAGVFRGLYHVLHGKLSPLRKVGPENLHLNALKRRLEKGEAKEIILALSNDIEGETTCHYIREHVIGNLPAQVTRIGFGLPSGGGVMFADEATLKSALKGRRDYT